MTILTIRIRCPKTVNLFNKAHQHMRGTSCTKFTLWICLFRYSMTVWLSWTHTWHIANRNIFFMLSSITETTCFSLNNHSVVQLKMSVRLKLHNEVWHPQKPVFVSITHLLSHSLTLCLSLSKQGHDIQGYSNFLVAQALKTQFQNAPPLTKYNKTAQLHLRDKTSLCQCEGIITQ